MEKTFEFLIENGLIRPKDNIIEYNIFKEESFMPLFRKNYFNAKNICDKEFEYRSNQNDYSFVNGFINKEIMRDDRFEIKNCSLIVGKYSYGTLYNLYKILEYAENNGIDFIYNYFDSFNNSLFFEVAEEQLRSFKDYQLYENINEKDNTFSLVLTNRNLK